MVLTPPSGGAADEKVTIHRRVGYLCPQVGWAGYVHARCLPQAGYLRFHFYTWSRKYSRIPLLNSNICGKWERKVYGERGWLPISASTRLCSRTYWQKRAGSDTPARMDQEFTDLIWRQRKSNLFSATAQLHFVSGKCTAAETAGRLQSQLRATDRHL